MTSEKDIYLSAQVLIDHYGDEAEDHVEEKLYSLMDKDDIKAASVWLGIAHAMDTLRERNKQKYLM